MGNSSYLLSMNLYNLYFDDAGKVVVGGGSDKKTNFMEPTVVSGVKLDDPLMQVILKKKKDIKKEIKIYIKNKQMTCNLIQIKV